MPFEDVDYYRIKTNKYIKLEENKNIYPDDPLTFIPTENLLNKRIQIEYNSYRNLYQSISNLLFINIISQINCTNNVVRTRENVPVNFTLNCEFKFFKEFFIEFTSIPSYVEIQSNSKVVSLNDKFPINTEFLLIPQLDYSNYAVDKRKIDLEKLEVTIYDQESLLNRLLIEIVVENLPDQPFM